MANRVLDVIERPLVLMDRTLFNDEYMGMAGDPDGAHAIIRGLKDNCRRTGGEFVVLWHNSQLTTPQQRELYEETIAH